MEGRLGEILGERQALSGAGRRAGGARTAVVELLAGQSCCLSAQEIADELRTSRTKVGLASIYRALDRTLQGGRPTAQVSLCARSSTPQLAYERSRPPVCRPVC